MPGSEQRLRHRRNKQDSETKEDELEPLIEDVSESLEGHDAKGGYKLEPLIERSVLMRLDVGPFVLCYGVLIALDSTGLHLSFLDYLFPMILLVHLTIFLSQQWSVRTRATVGFKTTKNIESMTHCLVETPHVDKHHSAHDDGIVQATKNEDGVIIVKFRDVIFRSPTCATNDDADTSLWSNGGGSVEKKSLRSFHRLRYPVNLPLSFYKQWKGFMAMPSLLQAQKAYGPNTTPIELPPFLALLQEQVVAPFFLFQVLCVILWSLDEYWYYAIFTFFALLLFESTVANNRLQSLQRLRSHTRGQERPIFVYRPAYPPGERDWTPIPVSELVPGDVVSYKHVTTSQGRGNRKSHKQEQQLNRIAADILIIAGDAVVDESLLTGESVPQLKGALSDTATGVLDLQEHRDFILFGGTSLLVANAGTPRNGIPESPDGGVIGLVLRTGFETAQGSLLRTMSHTQKSVDGIHTRDTYVFIFMLLCCAIASAIMVLQVGWNDPTRNRFRLLLHVIIIITSVVPPELPMELSLAVTNSVASLIRDCQVYCTEVFRIPLAGQVTVCCFDKTGTLTSDEMQLIGVRFVGEKGEFRPVVTPDADIPWHVSRIMVACHSLALDSTRTGRSTHDLDGIIGDPLEKAVLANTGYRLIQNNALGAMEPSDGRPTTVLVLQRFRFSSKLKRMSVLVREDTDRTTWILSKGAPEIIKRLVDPKSIPVDYDEVSRAHMSAGQRVLAIAYRKIKQDEIVSSKSIQKLDRESAEKDLLFTGFLLMDSPVKADSRPVISELARSGHICCMITGDALLTATSVARQVGILPKPEAVLYQIDNINGNKDPKALDAFGFLPVPGSVDSKSNDSKLQCVLSKQSLNAAAALVETGKVALCLSGTTLDQIGRVLVTPQIGPQTAAQKNEQLLFHPSAQSFLKELVPLVSVFARHAPRQKEAIIAAFNEAGFQTLMCGDGTNDMGALRRAHVGISLISAPGVEAKQRAASIAIAQERNSQRKVKNNGNSRRKASSGFEESLRQLREAQEELDNVELGDASIASPFTSRSVSIKCCKDVLQQGRCTLVTMLQIYKILGVNCLVNATVLSKLFLHGVKNGDRQLTILGVGVAALFFFVTRGKPLRKLSATRPPASVLCVQAILSIALQFAVHLGTILLSAQVALSFVDPFDPSMIPDGPFNPNTLNSCTFLLSAIATVNTFAINYRGEPFMEPLWQNKLLLRSLQVCYAVLFCCALEVFPPLNDLLQLSEMPVLEPGEWSFSEVEGGIAAQAILYRIIHSIGFQGLLCALMAVDTLLAFGAERVVLRIFEP